MKSTVGSVAFLFSAVGYKTLLQYSTMQLSRLLQHTGFPLDFDLERLIQRDAKVDTLIGVVCKLPQIKKVKSFGNITIGVLKE